jgi:hypothetical protein
LKIPVISSHNDKNENFIFELSKLLLKEKEKLEEEKDDFEKNKIENSLTTLEERKRQNFGFNVDVDESITKNVKRAIQMMNPGIKNTNKQLFGDLYQEFELDRFSRQLYSTPNTKISNDQSAYSQYLYGLMPSAKESTPEANMQRVKDNFRYTLY